MNQYHIPHRFLDLAVSFGEVTRASDAGHGAATIKQRADGSYGNSGATDCHNLQIWLTWIPSDIQYLLAFPDECMIDGSLSWTMRQVAVFHRYNPSGSGNLWLALHAKLTSKAQQRIEAEVASENVKMADDWSALHTSIILPYLNNWQWYLRKLGDLVEKHVSALDFIISVQPAHHLPGRHCTHTGPVQHRRYRDQK